MITKQNKSRIGVIWLTAFSLAASWHPAFGQSERVVSAIVAAEQYAEIAAPRNGVITELTTKLGQRVQKGDILARLECGADEARSKAAIAEKAVAQHDFDVQKKRAANGAGGASSVTRAHASLNVAKARVAVANAEINLCQIVAPFDGVIADVAARSYEAISVGMPLLTLFNDSNLRIELILSADWVQDIAPGTAFTFATLDNNVVFSAEITILAPRIDPVSQTVRAYGRFKSKTDRPRAGTAGTASF